MKKWVLWAAWLLCLIVIKESPAFAQSSVSVDIVAILVDNELSVRPVPRHAIKISSATGSSQRIVTGLDGKTQLQLAPGTYTFESERPVEFQGKTYKWSVPVVVGRTAIHTIELSNDNAVIEAAAGATKPSSDLPSLFRRWQHSVVTVWSDTGHGSGFVIDKRGLIATNQHVVGVSGYTAVQLSEDVKVPAIVVAKSQEKDVAILRVNPKYLANIEPVTLAYSTGATPPATEGDQVFTIGSPLNQRRIMTSGIVSKVEARAIISDVNINHGNSGGPLFTMNGVVIGITTFGDFTGQGGPGISGIVRIEEARGEIEKAHAALTGEAPSDRTLPVEPIAPYPLDSLKELVSSKPVKASDYEFSTGGFDIAVMTPVLNYGLQYQYEQESLKERAKRNKKAESVKGTTESFAQYRNWAEYVGEFRPVLMIEAQPKLVEGFWSSLERGMAASQGMVAGPARVHFKSDFYQMELKCGAREVVPIHPGKVEYRVDVQNRSVSVNDASYAGLYTYAPDAIGPHCGEVTLTLFTEKEPEKGEVRKLSPKLVNKIWDDFAAYRKVASATTRTPQKTALPAASEPVAQTVAPAAAPVNATVSMAPTPTTANTSAQVQAATTSPSPAPTGTSQPAVPFSALAQAAQSARVESDANESLRQAQQHQALGNVPDAITAYERALTTMSDGDPRKKAVAELLSLLRQSK